MKAEAVDKLACLTELARAVNSTLDRAKMAALSLELIARGLEAEAACLFLTDKANRLTLASDGFFYWKRDKRHNFNKWLCQQLAQRVLRQCAPFFSNDFLIESQTIQYRHSPKRRPINSIICLPLRRYRSAVGTVAVINKLDGKFSSDDLKLMESISDIVAIALHNIRLYNKLREESKEKNILYLVGKKISSSLDLDEMLNTIVDALAEVVRYDAVAIYLVEPGTQDIKRRLTRGYLPEMEEKVHLKIGEGIVGWAVKTGKGVIVPDVSRDARYVNARAETRSEVAVPIIAHGKTIGALNVESDRLAAYNDEELKLLEVFAGQAAISLDLAMLHSELIERERLSEELAIARRIQQKFLPRHDPVIEGFDISGLNVPSREVGGDYYDFIRIGENELGLVIGDVVGKGMPAALIMAFFRAGLIAEVKNNHPVSRIMELVSDMLCESTESNEFVTAFYGVLDLSGRRLTYCNAGHNYPLLCRRDGSFISLTEGGQPLGIFPQNLYQEMALELESGDILILYTDGVVEARVPSGSGEQEFGIEGLKRVVAENRSRAAREIRDAIYKAVSRPRDEAAQQDDITIVVVKVE